MAVLGYFPDGAPAGYVLTDAVVQTGANTGDNYSNLNVGAPDSWIDDQAVVRSPWEVWGQLDGADCPTYRTQCVQGGILSATKVAGDLTSDYFCSFTAPKRLQVEAWGSFVLSDVVYLKPLIPDFQYPVFCEQVAFDGTAHTLIVGYKSTTDDFLRVSRLTVPADQMSTTVDWTAVTTSYLWGFSGFTTGLLLGSTLWLPNNGNILVNVTTGVVTDGVLAGSPQFDMMSRLLGWADGDVFSFRATMGPSGNFYLANVSLVGATVTVSNVITLEAPVQANGNYACVTSGGMFYLVTPDVVVAYTPSVTAPDPRVVAGRHPLAVKKHALIGVIAGYPDFLNGDSSLLTFQSADYNHSGSGLAGSLIECSIHFGKLIQMCRQELVKL